MSTSTTIKTFGKIPGSSAPDSAAVASETQQPISVSQTVFDEAKALLSTYSFVQTQNVYAGDMPNQETVSTVQRKSDFVINDQNIEIFALLIADVHEKTGIALTELFDSLNAHDGITFSNKALALINKMRPPTSQIGMKIAKQAPKQIVSRAILP